jgi:hypothetical protein
MGKADLLLGSLVRQQNTHIYLHTYIFTQGKDWWRSSCPTTEKCMMQQACQWIDSNTCRSRRKKEGRKGGRRRCVLGQLTNYWEWMNEWMNAYMLPACMHASVTSLWKSRVSHPAEIQVFSVWNSLLGLTQLYNNPHPKNKFITFTLRVVVVDGLGFWWGKNLLHFFLVYLEV